MEQEWIIIDTETDGLAEPIHVLEIAAQRMRGWEKSGKIFLRLVNHGVDIPPKVSAVHGYTREILERDGTPPGEVYDTLRDYIGGLPVVAYNLKFDWDKVLVPEWNRLGIQPIGERGFCALDLARRLLGTIPAGNFKLQTLRRYFQLPERSAHSADGDVLATVDLFTQVLQPAAKRLNITTWDGLVAKSEEDWYPQRLSFGKFKGRDFREAGEDKDFRSWLEWLSSSDNERSSKMGSWYLAHLDTPPPEPYMLAAEDRSGQDSPSIQGTTHIIPWRDQDAEELRRLVETARDRVAGLETELASIRAKVDQVRAKIFHALRPLYEKRDSLRLKIEYRKMYIDTLLAEGEESAEDVEAEFQEKAENTRRQYEETAHALEDKHVLSKEEEKHLQKLWKKLVRLYHPDKFHNDPEKREAYEKLTADINQAKDSGDIRKLEEIAADPDAYLAKMGLRADDLQLGQDKVNLRKVWEALQERILQTLEEIDAQKASEDFDLFELAQKDDSLLDKVVGQLSQALEEMVGSLEAELAGLDQEIENLTS
jgi:DNA polymerase III epsilon subunit-like protein